MLVVTVSVCFQIHSSQIFEEVEDVVFSIMDGFNVTIFAYGQAGSGKTHTMEVCVCVCVCVCITYTHTCIIVPSYNSTDFFATRMKRIVGVKVSPFPNGCFIARSCVCEAVE